MRDLVKSHRESGISRGNLGISSRKKSMRAVQALVGQHSGETPELRLVNILGRPQDYALKKSKVKSIKCFGLQRF